MRERDVLHVSGHYCFQAIGADVDKTLLKLLLSCVRCWFPANTFMLSCQCSLCQWILSGSKEPASINRQEGHADAYGFNTLLCRQGTNMLPATIRTAARSAFSARRLDEPSVG